MVSFTHEFRYFSSDYFEVLFVLYTTYCLFRSKITFQGRKRRYITKDIDTSSDRFQLLVGTMYFHTDVLFLIMEVFCPEGNSCLHLVPCWLLEIYIHGINEPHELHMYRVTLWDPLRCLLPGHEVIFLWERTCTRHGIPVSGVAVCSFSATSPNTFDHK